MKVTLLMMIFSLLVVTGCSSKKKEVEENVNNEVEQVQTTATETVEEVKEEVAEVVEETEAASSYACSQGSDERMIEVVKGDNPKCEVFYTKNGEKVSIAHANWDVTYCDKVVNQVKTNLTNAGFSCN